MIQLHEVPNLGSLKKFVSERIGPLVELAGRDPMQAKDAFLKHMPRLILQPKETPEGNVFSVSGDWNLNPGNVALLVVAREGLEPPTRGFSVRCSTN